MKAYGFPCKTPGCETWIPLRNMPDDGPRTMHFPINLGPNELRLTCAGCNQEHEYLFTDRQIVQVVD